jgi:hypothetical protein
MARVERGTVRVNATHSVLDHPCRKITLEGRNNGLGFVGRPKVVGIHHSHYISI